MNRIYKVIWSKVRNCYVVVSEIAKRQAKSAAGHSRRRAAAVLAAGLVLAPLVYAPLLPEVNAASATNITDGGGSSLVESGNRVHELYAQQVTGENGLGISRYRDFTLAEKEIANMRFHEQGKNVEALNLLNLVQNRVDINGTVNAIRGNKIDGGLYFLSSNGIAIGPQGVINAGSFTAMVPSEDYFDKLDGYAADKDAISIVAEFDNSIQEHDANHPFEYNNENSSNISIEGRINTRGVRERK